MSTAQIIPRRSLALPLNMLNLPSHGRSWNNLNCLRLQQLEEAGEQLRAHIFRNRIYNAAYI